MYKVAILDDEKNFLEEIHNCLQEYEMFEVSYFQEAKLLIDEIDYFDVVYIDYEMENMTAFEFFKENNKYYIIDFGHTPNGIKATLLSLNKVKKGRIITILGAQGNKDKTKRPLMGKFATELSDITIFTSEDPKDEKITNILSDLTRKTTNNYYLTLYRDEAIRLGVSLMMKNDILVIFGKGRENTEHYGNYIFHHSDLKLLKEALNT